MIGDTLKVIQEYESYQLSKNGGSPSMIPEHESSETDKVVSEVPLEKPPDHFSDAKAKLVFIKNVLTSPSKSIVSGKDFCVIVDLEANDDSIPYRVAVKIILFRTGPVN